MERRPDRPILVMLIRGRRVIKLTRLPKDKDVQVEETVRCMAALTVSEAWSPELFWLTSLVALPLIGLGEIPARFSRFVKQRVRFELDPRDVELIRLPSSYARDIRRSLPVSGDCDDMALLLGAMLSNRGFRVQYVVMAVSPHNPEFRHVFTKVFMGGGKWVALDPSVERNYETKGLRTKEYLVSGPIPPMR